MNYFLCQEDNAFIFEPDHAAVQKNVLYLNEKYLVLSDFVPWFKFAFAHCCSEWEENTLFF